MKPQATDLVRATGTVNPAYIEDDGFWYYRDPDDYSAHDTQYRLLKPTWAVGDRLWVKETHFLELPGDYRWDAEGLRVSEWPEYLKTQCIVHYRQGCDLKEPEAWRWAPSIYMPRWASRIELVVTEVRVERLQDISGGDALAEGIRCPHCGYTSLDAAIHLDHALCINSWLKACKANAIEDDHDHPAVTAYRNLWDSINGETHPWALNPWVWVIEFKRVEVPRG